MSLLNYFVSWGIRCRSILATLLIVIGLGAIAPSARSETKQLNFILSPDESQTFETLLQQAESLAIQSIEQKFAQSPSITKVYIRISVENNGQQAPIMYSKVSRSDWQRNPTIQRWTQYFPSSGVLLNFYNRSAPPQPQSDPKPAEVRLEDEPGFRDD